MTGTKTIVDYGKIGTKGYPRHPELYGLTPPTKEVPVEGPSDPGTAPDLPPTKTDVDRERDRRIVAGKSFAVTGAGNIPVTGRPEDQVTLLALKDTARDLKAAGVTDAIIPYRDGANTDHLLTADQVISLTDQGKAYVTKLYQASWTLKAMDPIPSDYTDDSHWPAAS